MKRRRRIVFGKLVGGGDGRRRMERIDDGRVNCSDKHKAMLLLHVTLKVGQVLGPGGNEWQRGNP